MYGVPEARPVLGAPPRGHARRRRPGSHAGDTVRAIDGERDHDLAGRCAGAAAGGAAARAGAARDRRTSAGISRRRRSTCAASRRTTSKPTCSSASACASTGRRCRRCSARSSPAAPPSAPGCAPATASSPSTARRSTTWEAFVDAIARAAGHGARARRVERGGTTRTLEVVPGCGERRRRRASAASAPAPRAAEGYADKLLDPRAATARSTSAGARRGEDLGHVGVQPEDARQDAHRRGFVEEPLAARSRSPTTPASRRRLGWISYLGFLALSASASAC